MKQYSATPAGNVRASYSMITAVIGLMLIITAVPGYSKTIYVAAYGDNGNAGTSDRPVGSIGRAVDIASDGDVVSVRSGRYELEKTLEIYNKKNIAIISDGISRPAIVFTKSDTYGILVGDNSVGVLIDGMSIEWKSEHNGNVIGIAGRDVVIKNNHIYFSPDSRASRYDGIKMLDTANNILIEGNEINGAPQQCIDSVGGSNIRIRGNLMYDCSNAVVLKGGAAHNLIEDNDIRDMKYGAIGLGGFTNARFIIKSYENLGTVVRNNIIRYSDDTNIGGGIFLRGAVSAYVHNNTILGAGIHIKSGGAPEAPIFRSRNNVISDNVIWSSGDDGIVVVDYGNDTGLLLENNCYWRGAGTGEFKIKGSWYSYKSFRKKYSFDAGSVFGEPGKTGEAGFYGSGPCIGKGADLRGNKRAGIGYSG